MFCMIKYIIQRLIYFTLYYLQINYKTERENMEKTEKGKDIELDAETAKIVNEKATKEGITREEAIKRIIRAKLDELKTQELLKEVAKEKGKTPDKLLNEILQRESQNQEFEENGVVYERFMIDLPQPIARFYRAMAYIKGIPNLPESLVVFDLADHVKAEIAGKSPEEWEEAFNLNGAFIDCDNREQLLLRTEKKD